MSVVIKFYRVGQKVMPNITSSNTKRFSRLVYRYILQEICNKVIIKYPTWSMSEVCIWHY